MKTDMENLKSSMAKTLTFFRRPRVRIIHQSQLKFTCWILCMSRVFSELIFYHFSLIYKNRSSSKLSCSKVNFAGKKFKLVCHGLSLWGGVGVSFFFSLNLLHFWLINTSVAVTFVHIKPFSKQFWKLCS